MNLNNYFDPVSLDKNPENQIFDDELFCKHIQIHTPDAPIQNISNFQIAIMGVCEDRASVKRGSSLAPDIVRNELYQLVALSLSSKIIDLGNFKNAPEISDTYYGVRDVIIELLTNNVIPIIIGGSQDISYAVSLAFEKLKKGFNISTVDYQPDYINELLPTLNSKNYLNFFIPRKENFPYFNYTNIGNQACFYSSSKTDFIEKNFFTNIRLGEIRNNIFEIEPYLRDSEFISIDLSSVKNSEAPGQVIVSPNGLTSDELCQITRLAGFSENIAVIGFFDLLPDRDVNLLTSKLVAQSIWYFIDSFSWRKIESPQQNPEEFHKYIVTSEHPQNEMIFFRSYKSNRWWVEVPSIKMKSKIIISCSENDYISAGKGDIPDIWLKAFNRLN